ncbi:MAG: hypothetical protein E7627_02040 [Ruminococcaceae bacterium]|nr:hypothetical protein [Oscillospiraceae bacterium]
MTELARSMLPNLIGNEKIKNILSEDLARGKSAHAYILEGPRGSGKHTAAMQICAAVLCENKDDPAYSLPCGKCSFCRKINSGVFVDMMTVSNGDKASIGVDQIRLIKETLYITPNDGNKKFYIIENAHLMTPQAQNAFLLALEEPPAYVMFLLLCENSAALLETVKSRAPSIQMERFAPDFIEEYLRGIYGSGSALHQKIVRAAHLSGGALGYAKELYEHGSAEMKLYETASDLVEVLVSANKSGGLTFVQGSLPKSRADTCQVLSLARLALRDLISDKKGGDLLFYSSTDGVPSFAKKVSVKRLLELSSAVAESEKLITANCSQNTVMTSLIMNG